MTEQLTADDVNDAQILKLLHSMTLSDPDYKGIADRLAPLSEVTLTEAEEGMLGRAALAVLLEDTQRAQAVHLLLQKPDIERFEPSLGTVATLVAVTFLLRTHIKYTRKPDGKWTFHIEHKPTDSRILSQLLTKIAALLPTGGE